jgi:alcohol dehydrogenase (cytochrome c)
MSPSFDPSAGLFDVSARETCMIFTAQAPPEGFKAGDRTRMAPCGQPTGDMARCARSIRSPESENGSCVIHPVLGRRVVDVGGVLSGDSEGGVFAADARTGKELWRYRVGAPLYAAPSTYMIGTRQYVIVTAGTTLTAFALPQH